MMLMDLRLTTLSTILHNASFKFCKRVFDHVSGPEVLFKTCVAMKFVDDDDDDDNSVAQYVHYVCSAC